jgi:SNF2 family DNA or RNA helicase
VERWLDLNVEESVLIGAVAVETITVLESMLKAKSISYRMIRGGARAKDREEWKNEFQAGKVRVMLVQQIAGSESITLTKASNSILVDHDLSPIPYTQFMGRTARQGQTKECTHYDLAFTAIQVERIVALRRGEGFDTETRTALEGAWAQCHNTSSSGSVSST